MKQLKNLRYTGEFTSNVACGLVKGLGHELVVGCGTTGKLEAFHYDLRPGLYSSVSLCPTCAAKQTKFTRKQNGGAYTLYLGGKSFATVYHSEGGWATVVSMHEGSHSSWSKTRREAEADALVWYRFFAKAVS